MLGILVLAAFELLGTVQLFCIAPKKDAAVKIWLGLVLGLMEMMWLPCLFAFAFDFTLKAQLWAMAVDAAATLICIHAGRKNLKPKQQATVPLKPLVLLIVPIAALAGYLQYTHTLSCVDGALCSGQSTYGDLCMHLSFATGLVGQSFPPEYSILPGTQLGYPFLVDALSATMLIFGTSLSLSFVVPGTLMTALIFAGLYFYAWEITKKKGASVLSVVLLLFSGGLGFLYTLDNIGVDTSALYEALYGYYKAPANMPEYNLRWVNALCDLIIPQRALMAGWTCLIPALYLLACAMREKRKLNYLALGLWAGPMVMIHTHSFLALGAISLGVLIYELIKSKRKKRVLFLYGIYGCTALILALPQLLVWTFPQTINGGSLRIVFNWVNNTGSGLTDGYLWFWIKNVGLMYIVFPIAALSVKSRRAKAISIGAFILYAIAEFIVFQPNVYDNSKLFFAAYIAVLPVGTGFLGELYNRLDFVKGRRVLAFGFVLVCILSGGISLAREAISRYQLFDVSHVAAAEYIKENTPEDAVFLTADNHNNTVAALTGRKIVCGSSLYLYFHGVDYSEADYEAALMLAKPDNEELYQKYGVDYIFISSYERETKTINGQKLTADIDGISQKYTLVYSLEGDGYNDSVYIYAVSDRAKALYYELQ